MTPIRDRPVAWLTRQFFAGMFDLGFLSDEATVSFTRLIVGVCAAFFSLGLLLTRAYAAKYVVLAEMPGPEPYRHAILVDHVFLFALPMWVVAFVSVLVAHSLFPDETDFRVLTPLPIARRLIFGAKALSLFMFAGLFTGSMHVAIAPLLIVTSVSKWAEGMLIARIGAALLVSVLASAFCVLAVAAVQGALLLLAPRGRAAAVATTVRSGMLCALMLCLPFIARLPGQSPRSLVQGASWWSFVPPAWFLGVERWMLGDTRPAMVHLAAIGAACLGSVCLIAVGSYAILYVHFERLAVRAVRPSGVRQSRDAGWRPPRRPVFAAMRQFVLVTLRRSALHQGVTLVVSAIGAGFVLNSFITHDLAGWLRAGGEPSPALMSSVLWTPFAFVYVSARAIRLAFLLPVESRANWVFRLTERESSRVDQLAATVRAVLLVGVAAPVVLLMPIQVRVLGPAALAAGIVTAAFGYFYVELLMKDWSRLPFTCSYIPGKGFVPQRILLGTFFFVTFTTVGTALANGAVHGSVLSLGWDAAIVAAAMALRRRRISLSRITPLEFEDVMPTELFPLKLSQE